MFCWHDITAHIPGWRILAILLTARGQMMRYVINRGVMIHWSGSVYSFNDKQSNIIDAKWKHWYISPSLSYTFILKFPWHVFVTISVQAHVPRPSDKQIRARKRRWGYLPIWSHIKSLQTLWYQQMLYWFLNYQYSMMKVVIYMLILKLNQMVAKA